MQLHFTGLELTFACLHAFRPPVMKIVDTKPSAGLVPSTAGSATTDSAGFPKGTTLWTPDRISNRGGGGRRAD